MKTYLLLGFLLGLSLSTFAQNQAYAPALARAYGGDLYASNLNDPEDKDISIMTGILSKLVQQEFNNGDTAINIERIRGSYIPGSGILFTVTQRMPFYSRPMLLGVNGRAAFPNRYGLTTAGGQATDVVVLEAPRATNTTRAKPRTTEKPASSSGGQQPTYALAAPDGTTTIFGDSISIQYNKDLLASYTTDGWIELNNNRRGNSPKIQDSVFAAKIPRMKKVLEKFLAEYTILLSKLKPEEKIWVTWMIKEDYWGIDQGKMACELSGRIVKQDMLDLRAGKLDQAKFAEKIQYSVTRCAERVTNPELEVFTAILQRLYSAEVSQNLIQYGGLTSDVVGGFGYVFKLNLMSRNFTEVRLDQVSGVYRVNPQNKETSKEEIENKIKAFKAEFPSQLLEYGRVIKGLKAGEILKVDVSVGNNGGVMWDSPAGTIKQLSYTVPQSLIRDYDSGKLKLEDAVKLIQVEEK